MGSLDGRSPLALEEELGSLLEGSRYRGLSFRRLTPSPVDLRLFLANGGDPATAAAAALESDPWIERVQRKGASLSVRLGDAYVEALGARLEERGRAAIAAGAALAGQRWTVNYLNPNATKPLHVGHLRNIATGRALAAGLRFAGASVVEQCYVCDIGRNVCEAMAGYLRFHDGEDPEATGERPDRFVGRCYAEYATSDEAAGAGAEDDPVGREAVVGGDLADELVAGWLAGEPEVRELWERLSRWSLDGQARTLRRLGVTLDHRHLESETLDDVRALAERGLASGMLRREPDGSVVHPTGRSEYTSVPLVRRDGFPTEHARVIALFLREAVASTEVDRWVVVCGDEWEAAGGAELEIARRLGAEDLASKVDVICHGMVTLAGSKMKSRDGKALLADDFLDELEASPAVRAAVEESGDRASPAAVAEIVAKGSFLARKVPKAVEFRWESLMDTEREPAWSVARAWCRSQAPDEAAAFDSDLYRTAAMQAHQVRQIRASAASGFAGVELMKLAVGVSRWFLGLSAEPRLARVVRAVLESAMDGLGVEPWRDADPIR